MKIYMLCAWACVRVRARVIEPAQCEKGDRERMTSVRVDTVDTNPTDRLSTDFTADSQRKQQEKQRQIHTRRGRAA